MLPFLRPSSRSRSPARKAHRVGKDDVLPGPEDHSFVDASSHALMAVHPSSRSPARGSLPFRVDVLDIILNDASLRKRFLDVLKVHYSEEGVLFLEAVRERTSLSPSKAKLKEAAKDIMKSFIVEGAQHEVNLSSDLRAQLEALTQKNGGKELALEDVFHAAVTQVYKDVKQNQWFSDFVQTSFGGRAGVIL